MIQIIVDSTADIPLNLVRELKIKVVPLNIYFGEESFKDVPEVDIKRFYQRMQEERIIPSTSQPQPLDFLRVYQEVLQEAEAVIVIHISEKLSGTGNSAQIAASMLDNPEKVTIIDSSSVCMGAGLIAVKAAELARKGTEKKEIIAQILAWREHVKVYFTVKNLDYLAKNGRIGRANALLGNILNIKPLLGIAGGEVVPVEKIRGNNQKVAQRMIAALQSDFGKKPLLLSVMHTNLPELATELLSLAQHNLHITNSYQNLIGPTLSSHSGPFTFGYAVLPGAVS